MSGYRVIRNSDGSAHIIDKSHKHVSSHDSVGEAMAQIDSLKNELHHHEKKDEARYEHQLPNWKEK